MQWTGTWHTKTWSRRSFAILRATNTSCICVNPVLTLQLRKNFLIRNSTNMKMMRKLITGSGAVQIKQYWQSLEPFTKNAKRSLLMLLLCYWWVTYMLLIPISQSLKLPDLDTGQNPKLPLEYKILQVTSLGCILLGTRSSHRAWFTVV